MMIEQLNKIIKDPVGYVAQFGLKIPQNINSSNDIIQYLLNTGQISQQKYNQAMSLAKRFM
jgi:alpha-D-ribose 1-methylphosphonate 5-triphosphate synthase subunit PhnL